MNYRKILPNILLTAVYAAIIALITVNLLAEFNFTGAKEFIGKYRWKDAERLLDRAINLNPYRAEYYAEFGTLIFQQAVYRDKRLPYLEAASALFKKASRLNPRCSDYYLKLAQTDMAILLNRIAASKDKALTREEEEILSAVIYNFSRALSEDPAGFNVAYQTGYALISLWDYLNPEYRELAIDRLRYSLAAKSWYSRYVYSKLWDNTADFRLLQRVTPGNLRSHLLLYDFILSRNLWKYHREERVLIDGLREKTDLSKIAGERERAERLERIKKAVKIPRDTILPGDWKGEIKNAAGIFHNGNMYWEGFVEAPIMFPGGSSTLGIEVRGFPAAGSAPFMIIELDGKYVAEMPVDSPDWKEYDFNIDTDAGIKVVSVIFANGGKDRSLEVGRARVKAPDQEKI